MKDKLRPSRLVVLSVDGMRPDFYRRPKEFGLKIPNLLELVKSGASADAVESIYPTTTYPAHAPLVTGVPPSVHGIYSHLASLDPTGKARPWCWFAQALRAPALWDVARASGRKIAALADTYHRPFAPHDCTGPVGFVASVHASFSQPNTLIQESVRAFYTGWYKELVTVVPTIRDGYVYPMEGPGLGTELLPAVFERPDLTVRWSEG